MDYWLVKSEPHKYSWEKFNEQGRTFWDGVRNYMARNNLRGMKEGDLVLFYHSNEGKEVVGIAKVVKEFYQDPTTDDPNWVVRQGRLSVMALKREEFDHIVQLGS